MVSMRDDGDRALVTLLSDVADLAWFTVDADRNVVEVSPAMERLTGFRSADVVGRSCLRLHRCEDCLRGCGVFEHGVVEEKTLQLYRADGSLIKVTKSGRVLFGGDGEISGAVEVVRTTPQSSGTAGASEPEEARRIRHALERVRYNRTAAARTLGVSRTSLWRKMKEYGI